jgi:hypothetical protein
VLRRVFIAGKLLHSLTGLSQTLEAGMAQHAICQVHKGDVGFDCGLYPSCVRAFERGVTGGVFRISGSSRARTDCAVRTEKPVPTLPA